MMRKLIGLNKNLGKKNRKKRRSRGKGKLRTTSCTPSRNVLEVYGAS